MLLLLVVSPVLTQTCDDIVSCVFFFFLMTCYYCWLSYLFWYWLVISFLVVSSSLMTSYFCGCIHLHWRWLVMLLLVASSSLTTHAIFLNIFFAGCVTCCDASVCHYCWSRHLILWPFLWYVIAGGLGRIRAPTCGDPRKDKFRVKPKLFRNCPKSPN